VRWLEDVEKDLREMKVERWRQKAFVIKEAPAHKGLYSQGESK